MPVIASFERKVIKETLIFAGQIGPLKESYQKKNFDFCLSNCPLKESNQKNFDFFRSKRPLKKSNQKTFFLPVKLSFERK